MPSVSFVTGVSWMRYRVYTRERSPVHAVAAMLVFTLRKIVSRLLFPTSAVVICLIAGLVLLVFGRRRDRRRLEVSGLVLLCVATGGLFLASLHPVADAFLWSLEGRYAPLLEPRAALAPVSGESNGVGSGGITIVVLGASHHEREGHGPLHSLSQGARERVVEGVRLAGLLPEADVIFTGGRIGGDRAIADVAAAAAAELGLDPLRIVRLVDPLDTASEARAVASALSFRPAAATVLLVTSASHMPRAAAEFRSAGIDAIPAPAAFSAAGRSYTPWSLIPSAAALERSERAVSEYLGLLAMRIGGR